jgi:hypothetical protein
LTPAASPDTLNETIPSISGAFLPCLINAYRGGKLIVASSGIGYLLVRGQANISTSIVMSGMIAIGGFAIDALLPRSRRGSIAGAGVDENCQEFAIKRH